MFLFSESMKISDKRIIGVVEKLQVLSNDSKKKLDFLARIDTGATMSSIDSKIVKELNLGPMIRTKKVKNANGVMIRPVIEANILLHGKKMRSKFTVSDRTNMKYKVLVGRNILKEGFLIDPKMKDEEE